MFKKCCLFFSLFLFFSIQPAMAVSDGSVRLHSTDMSFAFQEGSSISPVVLSQSEMSDIEGEFWFLVPVITSMITYSAPAVIGGSFSWAGLGWAAGAGLLGGGVYGSVGRMIGRSSSFGRVWTKVNGIGIGAGLNYSNPWKNLRR